MECFLPNTAFDVNRSSDVEECGDSTRCVEPNQLKSVDDNICDVSTPICNNSNDKSGDYVNKISSVTTNCTSVKNGDSVSGCCEVKTDVVEGVCKSPSMSFADRVKSLRKDGTCFAFDDSMSNVSICDGDLSVCIDDDYNTIDSFRNEPNSPETCTPIKSALCCSRGLDVLNSIHTRFDEPHVNISDDETKNPVLANSIRRVSRNNVAPSLDVLASSRCWTDRLDNEFAEGSLSATQSPVRSLASMVGSSQADISDSSFRRCSPDVACSPDCTPVRSYSRSISRIAEPGPRQHNNSEDFDSFSSMKITSMCKMDSNPMCNVTLSKEQLCRVRLSDMLEMLYKHFKNMCTVMRRSSMRNDKPYFRVIQMLVQRMSRRSFTMDNLLQMVWLAPNLVSIKWVLISDACKKKYVAEYNDSASKVYDLSIKILTPDSLGCSTTQDYELSCFRFKSVLCSWCLKCEYDGFDNFRVPIAQLPPKSTRSNQSTPRRASSQTPVRLDDTDLPTFGTPRRLSQFNYNTGEYVSMKRFYSTPIRMDMSQSTPIRGNQLDSTPLRHKQSGSTPIRYDLESPVGFKQSQATPMRLDERTPVRSAMKSGLYDLMDTTPVKSYRMTGPCSITNSTKRLRTMDTMSPMSVDLLDTPGMRRIRENARKLDNEKKMNMKRDGELKYWIDMRWFAKVLLDIMVGDSSPVFKIEFLVDFISKYGSRKVTQDQVSQWIDTLSEIDPSIISKSVSKFEDYSTIVTINKSASLDNTVDYINQQIKTLKTF